MAKCSQKMLLLPILLFVFSTAIFFVESVNTKGKVAFIEGASYYKSTQELKAKIAEGYEIVSSANAGEKDNYPNFLWTLVKKDDDDDKKNQIDALMQKIDTFIEKLGHDGKEQHLDNLVGKVETLGHKLDTLVEKIDQDRKEQKESVDTLVKAISSLVEQLDKKSGKLTIW